MSTSSSSIYWNIWRLVQQTSGGGDRPAVPSPRQRRLRARAYAILLDMEQDPYADVPEDSRQLVNAQAATGELLRLRAEGRHGTAARLTGRLDELEELQQQRSDTCGAPDDSIPRLVSLLLHLRGLKNAIHSTGGGTAGAGGSVRPALASATYGGAAAGALTDLVPRALLSAASLSDPGTADGLSGGAGGDGIPVGRRLRLLPPPRPAALVPFEAGPASSSSSRALAAAGPDIVRGAGVASSPVRGLSTAAVDIPAFPAVSAGWFPFRDCAGLPLLPAFDAPLDNLLLCKDPPQPWCTAGGTARTALPRLTAGAASSASGGLGADLRYGHAAAAADIALVVPLQLGPLRPTLVHTAFDHLNPLLLRLNGKQSECFSIPVMEADAFAAATAAEDAADGASDAGPDGLQPTVVPVPFALAALGVGVDSLAPGSLLPPPQLPQAAGTAAATAVNVNPDDGGACTIADPDMTSAFNNMAGIVPAGAAALVAADTAWLRSQQQQGLAAAMVPGGEMARVAPRQKGRTLTAAAKATGGGGGAVAAMRSAAEDEVFLYDMAVMALQGVASALWMLRNGVIRAHHIRLCSQGRLLAQLCETGELRLRLGNFVAAYGTYGTASHGAGGGAGGGQHDETLEAFADAVRELLALYDSELQELATTHRSGLATLRPRDSLKAETIKHGGSSGSGGGVGGVPAAPFSSLLAADLKASRGPGASPGPQPRAAGGAGAGGGMLGLLLCLAPLKIHLQRLADVCMCVPDPAWIPPHPQLHGAAATRVRGARREDAGFTGTRPPLPPPAAAAQLAPSLWQVYGFPHGPELLDRLYGVLLRTDHAKTPLLRLLFTAACMPYVRRMRAWMYDPQQGGGGGGIAAAAAAAPPPAPAFTAPLQRALTAAGLQIRLLEEMSGELGDIAARFRRMAAGEAEEARLIALQYDEALTHTSSSSSSLLPSSLALAGSEAQAAVAEAAAAARASASGGCEPRTLPGPEVVPGLGLLGGHGCVGGGSGSGDSPGQPAAAAVAAAGGFGCGQGGSGGCDEFNYPLVYGLEALQQLSEAAAAAAAARDAELTSLLSLLERRRRAAAEAADQRVLAAAQASLAAAEAARGAKVAAAQERRLVRSRLLAEQRAELDERAARARAERERRIAEEQFLAAEAVLREHNEAAAALAAELARLRASYGGTSYSESSAAGSSAAAAAGLMLADSRAAEAAARLRRCEWREARMALAARRRLLWRAVEAEDLDQLRQLVAAARSNQASVVLAANRLTDEEAAAARPTATGAGAAGPSTDSGEGPAPKQLLPDADAQRLQQLLTWTAQSSPGGTPRWDAASAAAAAAGVVAVPGPAPQVLAPAPDADVMDISPGRGGLSPSSSGGKGSPRQSVVVASIGRPRRATFHDSGPSVSIHDIAAVATAALAARASPSSATMAMPSLAATVLRSRASDGGAPAAPRTPHLDVTARQQRPIGPPPRGSGHRRSNSVSGAAAFAGVLTPSSTVPATWGALPGGGGFGPLGADAFLSQADLRCRGAPPAGGSFFRPPSPSAWSERGAARSAGGSGGGATAGRQGPPRGYMPSTRSYGGRGGPAGRGGGAAGGLLLEVKSRQLRRRWALPDSTAAAAAGGCGGSGAFLSPPVHSLGFSAAEQVEGAGSGAGGGAALAEAAAGPGPQQQPQLPGDTAAIAMWACAWPCSAAEANDLQDAGAIGGGQPRRRALWKVPSSSSVTAAAAAASEKSSALGALQPGYGSLSYMPPTKPFLAQLPHKMPSDGYCASGGVYSSVLQSPVKALLRQYLTQFDPRVLRPVHTAHESPTRLAQRGNELFFAFSDGEIHNRNVVVVGGGSGAAAAAPPRTRRAAVSEELAYAPVSVAVQTCLCGIVLAQYRLTTRAVWNVLVQEYRLLHFCAALRRFFFCEAGDVAGALADSLTRRIEARPHMPPATGELRAMLDEALQGCSLMAGRRAGGGAAAVTTSGDGAGAAPMAASHVAAGSGGDEATTVVQLLRVRSVPRRILGTGSFFASDVMLITCQVPRPLDAVIQPDSMRDYADVFSLLLRVRCAAAVLAGCWAQLNAATGPLVAAELGGGRRGRHGRGERHYGGGDVHPLWLKRLVVARLWLQAASQVVALLRQRLQMELQGRCWEGLAAALAGPEPQDLVQMREAHCRYLACARQVCMLPPRENVRDVADAAVVVSPTRPAAAIAVAGAALMTPLQPQPQQQQQPLLPLLLPGAPLMDTLQCSAAMAAVLRRALTALESAATTAAAALSAPPRQPTISPVLAAVSRGAQTAAAAGPSGGTLENKASLGAAGAASATSCSGPYVLPVDDLDELWAHVVVCQGRLGRALGALHAALRYVMGSGESGGLVDELWAVLESEPCRGFVPERV